VKNGLLRRISGKHNVRNRPPRGCVYPKVGTIGLTLREFTRPELHDHSRKVTEDYYEIVLPLSVGEAVATVNGKLLSEGELGPGMVMLASPNELIRTVGTRPARAAELCVPGDQLRDMIAAIEPNFRPGKLTFVDPIVTPSQEVARLAKLLIRARTLSRAGAALFADGLARSLIVLLLNNHVRQVEVASGARGMQLTPTQLEECIAFAQRSMTEGGLDVSTLAEAIGLDAAAFSRRFQNTTNQSPYAWFMQLRVERAKLLLADENLALSDIALELGFSSQSHFTEAFRRRVGVAPGHWRCERAKVEPITPLARS
jgi:AraC family transcriptional regulator